MGDFHCVKSGSEKRGLRASTDFEAYLSEVLAITEGLHDVQSLGKEAVAIHSAVGSGNNRMST
ncbi:hypothetical protein IFM89_035193 [Coptis chinensis]|uniref:Uncharacterized protein n=1 Tax=Coptis chinensis TaxID=261450 RepID=A0A835IHG8_9MAGN|nr:hypothetical protein IFM89_035193 [Coptis chinensis]